VNLLIIIYFAIGLISSLSYAGWKVGTGQVKEINVGNILATFLGCILWPLLWLYILTEHLDAILAIKVWTRKPRE
jgi:hypothetical protein